MLKEIDISRAKDYEFALIKTEKGDMKLKLFNDEAPIAVCNFASLAKEGFYKNLNFHRVIPNFVIQGGCPYGTGTGGPGYTIKCECEGQSNLHLRGTLSMAHAGKDTGGSQFFITHSPQPHLDGVHTVFGQIDSKDTKSLEVLDSIRQGDKILDIEIMGKSMTKGSSKPKIAKSKTTKLKTKSKKTTKKKKNNKNKKFNS
ncbi:peptidylprolyl isomerase [Campylobacter sp. MIT 99-7217]|nr:peptidylprolyl isomerase [Campylobacter sp. MIT 99-7217]